MAGLAARSLALPTATACPSPRQARAASGRKQQSIVMGSYSDSEPSSRIARLGVFGAAILFAAAPVFAADDLSSSEQRAKDAGIRASQESGKASPPPPPGSTGGDRAPPLQSPVRDVIGKVTGGSDGPPGSGTPAAPNTTP